MIRAAPCWHRRVVVRVGTWRSGWSLPGSPTTGRLPPALDLVLALGSKQRKSRGRLTHVAASMNAVSRPPAGLLDRVVGQLMPELLSSVVKKRVRPDVARDMRAKPAYIAGLEAFINDMRR